MTQAARHLGHWTTFPKSRGEIAGMWGIDFSLIELNGKVVVLIVHPLHGINHTCRPYQMYMHVISCNCMYMFMYMYIDTHAGPLNVLRGSTYLG